jgi:hypothetical protein
VSFLDTPRLGALARKARERNAMLPGIEAHPARSAAFHDERAAPLAACDLCSESLGGRHGHLVDLREQALRCVCRACALLFDQSAAGGEHYRLVPERVELLEDFRLGDLDWVALRIPVELAFFFHSSAAGRVVALYPGPMGATESLLGLEHWERLTAANAELSTMLHDVEALLVDRTRGKRDGWLVPIDACYELVGLFRTRWKGLSGGSEVWDAVEGFFTELRRRAQPAPKADAPVPRNGRRRARQPTTRHPARARQPGG